MKNDISTTDTSEWSTWHRSSELDDKNYINFMSNCLSKVKDKTVLELGSFGGWHTEIMLKFNPKKIICVEPNKECIEEEVYKKNTGTITLHSCTANDYYTYYNDLVDIVVCCGLLYHLHSPIHLLEKIINISKPKYILIETIDNSDIGFHNAKFHVAGNAYADINVKFPILKFMSAPANSIIECVETTNYRVEKINRCKGQWNNNRSTSHIVSTILFKNVDSE
jgi:SAM-dependent methyltransferase